MSEVERTTGAEAVAKILERAIEVIAEGGEAAIRTNPIAYDCGTTPPVLYRAYGSREGLVVAAQAERYRRTMEDIASDLSRSFMSAESPDDLRARVRQGMAVAFSAQRSVARRNRAEVMGAAVSRPELQARIAEADRGAVGMIRTSLERAVAEGWISGTGLDAVIMWAFAVTNGRLSLEFDDGADYGGSWDKLALGTILDVLFAPR